MRPWVPMGSLFLSDEERVKKDDDHKPGHDGLRSDGWRPTRVRTRKTFKRLMIALLIGIVIYLFIKNIPTDLPIRDHRHPTYTYPDGNAVIHGPVPAKPKDRPAPKTSTDKVDADERPPTTEYNGPVKLLSLATSLQAISTTRGFYPVNKNVLFAAASLKSVAALLPMACQMGSELRSYVHFALMSRSEIEMDELRAINGIDDSCQVIFHDARPDYSLPSTEARLENSVGRAMHQIYTFMHPQAIIVDGSYVEEPFFLRVMRAEASNLGVTLVDLPGDALNRLKWMAKLDSASLAAWDQVNIDILIHAQPEASGSLIRLLKSLSDADFTGCSIPHLTIELPQSVDPPTQRFLESFRWPPIHLAHPGSASLLSLRHRINRQLPTTHESTIRFLESFWPVNPSHDHVLVLSPQVELSQHFLHYLKYTVLEYKHSYAAILQEWSARLLGISLDLPSMYLNGSEPFAAPTKKDVPQLATGSINAPTSFLWQAPSSNAVLYMGEKWVELHGYVSRRMDAERAWHRTPTIIATMSTSRRHPAWLEHAVKLSRARGYWTLYPSEAAAGSLAVVHRELSHLPEEYQATTPVSRAWTSRAKEVELRPGYSADDLLDSLPDGGGLPPFDDMPLLTWDGEVTSLGDLDIEAAEFTKSFRFAIGGCQYLVNREPVAHKDARDLFCREDD